MSRSKITSSSVDASIPNTLPVADNITASTLEGGVSTTTNITFTNASALQNTTFDWSIANISSSSTITGTAANGDVTDVSSATFTFTCGATIGATSTFDVVVTDSNGYSDSKTFTLTTAAVFDPTDPYGTYGNGSDGDATSLSYVGMYVSSTSTSSITVGSASGFSSGDIVLLVQHQDGTLTNGTHEYLKIDSISGTTINFTSNLQNSYAVDQYQSTSDAQVTAIYRVPQFDNLTISSTQTLSDWNGYHGGVIVVWVKDTLTINDGGSIHQDGAGFRGGIAEQRSDGASNKCGENQKTYSDYTRSGVGNGGGGGLANVPGVSGQGHGGGGAHANAGGTDGSNVDGLGGNAWGSQDLTTHLGFGGAGGAGGDDYGNIGGDGGAGGGIVVINAATIVMNGTSRISADGDNGTRPTSGGGGAGGAGGSVFINCDSITGNGTNSILADRGTAGNGASAGNQGSVGRIHIRGTQSGSFTITPSAYTG